ncbi:SH3 domain-containing protein [Streptomyces sp. TRM S81-3]|uniref:SH3 domain-containing protein n=1 Tax=Streptomyces griseicoloratus TaxID=2752516 RepID=A0A926KYV6_9ACTN|nr:SH3 domain-containing protein [Streptomyces griseicoloratus]MBD0418501.1 SH3 domain-containing protein [Streptomyces griseicoloratus]
MTTRPFTRAALAGAGALALLGPLTATTALAATDADRGDARVLAAPYAVEPYETVNVRSGPARSYAKVGSVAAGQPRGAYCWIRGETVSDNGYTNNVWVKLVEGYVSAVYLKGDEYGGLPASATC